MGMGGGVLTLFLVPCADEGAAPKMHNVGGIAQTLSIHAPARARLYYFEIIEDLIFFQSTRQRGRDKSLHI